MGARDGCLKATELCGGSLGDHSKSVQIYHEANLPDGFISEPSNHLHRKPSRWETDTHISTIYIYFETCFTNSNH